MLTLDFNLTCVAMVMVMVLNTTFYNISVISLRLFVLVEEAGVSGENHRTFTDKLYHLVTTMVVVGTVCTCSCKSNI